MEILDQNLNQDQLQSDNELQFHGDGAQYFGIVALNFFLTVITLGIYYPWAKTTYRKYIWNEIELNDSRFTFNGTGKEVFFGILKLIGILIGFFLLHSLVMFLAAKLFGFSMTNIVNMPTTGMLIGALLSYLIVMFFFLLLMGFAIYGSYRYRISRTSWRGIYFGFDGNSKEFLKLFLVNLLLTFLTLGIYGAWMRTKIMKYLFSHTTLGQYRLDFHGEGGTLFGINIIAFLLIIPTLYLYTPIWIKERFNFTINNTTIEDGDKRRALRSTLESGEAWKTLIINGLLLVFTVGLAFPWVIIRVMRMYFDNIKLPSDFDFDELTQADTAYNDASGDELGDFLDIGLDF